MWRCRAETRGAVMCMHQGTRWPSSSSICMRGGVSAMAQHTVPHLEHPHHGYGVWCTPPYVGDELLHTTTGTCALYCMQWYSICSLHGGCHAASRGGYSLRVPSGYYTRIGIYAIWGGWRWRIPLTRVWVLGYLRRGRCSCDAYGTRICNPLHAV